MKSKYILNFSGRIVPALLILVGILLLYFAISDHPLYGGGIGFGMTQWIMSITGVALALCSMLPARLAGSILLMAITSIAMLAVAEIAGEAILGSRFRPNYQYDERLIFKFIPNRSSVMTHLPVNGGETVTHRINSDGYRGPELLSPGKATRIAVYGDSFIHAFYTRDEQTFSAQLASMLASRTGKAVEVVNAGVSSYGPDQESVKMSDELPVLRPDLAIVAIFAGNDYGDLMRDKMFKLGENGALMENHWQLDPVIKASFDNSQRESILKRALRNITGSLRTQSGRNGRPDKEDQADIDFLLQEAEREYKNYIVDGNNIVTNTHVDYYSADVSLKPRNESSIYKIALMKAVMRRIRDVADQNGTSLVFLFIPHPVDVTDHYDNWVIDRTKYPDYDGRNQVAPLEEAAKSLRVPYVNLYDIFRKHDVNLLYLHEDDHWNAAGQKLAAEVMAEYILQGKSLGHSMLKAEPYLLVR